MNKFFPVLCALFLVSGTTVAGQSHDKFLSDIPPPTPPLVARAANPASWIITVKPKGKGPLAPGSNPRLPQKYLARQTWIKSGDKMQCTNEWTDKSKTVDWVAGPMELLQNTQGTGINLYNPATDIFCHDFSQGDFERLDWLTPKDYLGAIKYQGEDCYLFRSTQIAQKIDLKNRRDLTAAERHAPVSPTTVLISVKSRLPVMIANDDGEFDFQFQPPPATALEMPEPYASLWKAINQKY